MTETVADDTITEDAEEVTAMIDDGGDIDSASQTIDERNTILADARETLDDLSIVDLAEIEDATATLDYVLSSMIGLGSGYETIIEGYDAFETGEHELENENFEAAADAFGRAEASFETATQTFEEGAVDAPSDLSPQFETARCQSSGLATAAGHFEAAATAGRSGG